MCALQTGRLVRANFNSDYVPLRKQALDFSNSENPLGCSPTVLAKLQSLGQYVAHYPDRGGDTLLSALFTKHALSQDSLFVSNGATGCIQAVISAFVTHGKVVVLPELSFPLPIFSATIMGGAGQQVPMKDDSQIDFYALFDAVSANTGVVFLCNPNNPTGLLEKPENILNFARSVKVPVLVSEANIEYAPDFSLLPLKEEWPENLIVVRSFSKAYGLAGLRVGVGVASPDLVRRIEGFRLPFAVSGLSQALAVEALTDDAHLACTRTYVEQELNLWKSALEELGFSALPVKSNTLLVRTPNGVNATSLIRSLERQGITVIGGACFHPNLSAFMRLAPRDALSNKKLVEVVEMLV